MSLPLPKSHEVHLWLLPHRQGKIALLSPIEQHHLRSYHQLSDQHRYCFTQSAKREILGAYLQLDPAELQFQENKHGKPSLTGLEFSISHTTGISVLAVTTEASIGVDIESLSAQDDLPNLARHISTAREWESYRTLPEQEKLSAFHRLWTAKEAYLKNLGIGLAVEPNQVITDFSEPSSVKTEGYPKRFLSEKSLRENAIILLATSSQDPLLSCYEFPSVEV